MSNSHLLEALKLRSPWALGLIILAGCGAVAGPASSSPSGSPSGTITASPSAGVSPSASVSAPASAGPCVPPPSATAGTYVSITCVSSPTRLDSIATIQAKGRPGTPCTIMVHADGRGFSRARGLDTRSMDASGVVTWDWLVDVRPGTWTAQVFCAVGTMALADIVVSQ